MYKIKKKTYTKSEFIRTCSKDRNDIMMLLTSNFSPLGLASLDLRLYPYFLNDQNVYKDGNGRNIVSSSS